MEFSDYAKALAKVKKLTPPEEVQLWEAYKKNGELKARTRIIEAYQPLVFREATPFSQSPFIMDVVQEGTVGLIEAVENYVPDKKVAFSLYAVHRIRGRMLNLLAREGKADLPYLDAPISSEYDETPKNMLSAILPTAEAETEQRQLLQAVYTSMDRLPQKERAVLAEVYLESMPVAAIAQSMELSVAHVYRLKKQAIQRIRGMLAKFRSQWK